VASRPVLAAFVDPV